MEMMLHYISGITMIMSERAFEVLPVLESMLEKWLASNENTSNNTTVSSADDNMLVKVDLDIVSLKRLKSLQPDKT